MKRFARAIAVGLLVASVGACNQAPVQRGWHQTFRIRPSELTGPVTLGGEWAFVPNMSLGTVTQIDRGTDRVMRTISVADPSTLRAQGCAPDSVHAYYSGSWGWRACDTPYAIAWDGQSLLALDDGNKQLVVVDPSTGTVASRINLPGTGWSIAATATTAWVSGWDNDAVYVVDLAAGRVVASIPGLDQGPSWIGLDPNAVWVICGRGVGDLDRIDPRTFRVVDRYPIEWWSNGLVAIGGALFVRGTNGSDISRIDAATGRVLWTKPGPGFLGRFGIDQMGLAAGELWLSGPETEGIDPQTGKQDTVLKVSSSAVAGTSNELWLQELDGSIAQYRYS